MDLADAVIATVFGIATVYLGLGQHRVQGRLASLEKDRRSEEIADRTSAYVTAYIDRRDRGHSFLVLENKGEFPATNVAFDLSPVAAEMGVQITVPWPDQISKLDPGGTWELPLFIPTRATGELLVSVEWVDGQGEKKNRLPLNIGY